MCVMTEEIFPGQSLLTRSALQKNVDAVTEKKTKKEKNNDLKNNEIIKNLCNK